MIVAVAVTDIVIVVVEMPLVIRDFPDVVIFRRDWRSPLKVNIQFKVRK